MKNIEIKTERYRSKEFRIKANDSILRPVNVDKASNSTLLVSKLDISVESRYLYNLRVSIHSQHT